MFRNMVRGWVGDYTDDTCCLFSERKGSMCPGVMIENARKDACTECSICQSPRYAK